MNRRLALILIAVVLAFPATGSAERGPLQTAGIAYIHEDHSNGAFSYVATFAFEGSIQLNGGSAVGPWGLKALVQDGAFGPTPISKQEMGIPFPSGLPVVVGLAEQMRSASAAPESSAQSIGGSCSGTTGGLGWNLTCDFHTSGGLSARRKIEVFTPIFDVTDLPCDVFCEPTHTSYEQWGIYTRNIAAL